MHFKLTSPLRFHRTPAQGTHYSLGVFIGRDHLEQTDLPFWSYIRQIHSLRIRCLGWVLAADLTSDTEEQRQLMEYLEEMAREAAASTEAAGGVATT